MSWRTATGTQTATQNGEDLFRQAIGAWESAVDSGVKMQEEYASGCGRCAATRTRSVEWYNKGQAMAGETIVKAQENIDEAMRVINQQAESSVRLMQKALDARQSEAPLPTPARDSPIGGRRPWKRCGPTPRQCSKPTATC